MESWFRLLADVSDLLDDVSTDTASMGSPATPLAGTSGELRFPPPYSVEEYSRLHLPRIDARCFAIMPTGEAFIMCAFLVEKETAFAGWLKTWKHWGGRRDLTVATHADFMDMPSIRSYKEVAYEGRLAVLMTRLRNDAVVPEGVSLDLWCGGSDLREKWFVDNYFYWPKDIELEIRFSQRQEEWHRMFVGWHIVEIFAVPPARRCEVFVSVPGWWSRYDDTHLLYVPSSPVFRYCTACWNKASHSFGHSQFGHHGGGFLVTLPNGILGDAEALGFYDVIRLCCYDPVLCQLAVRRSQEVDWLPYSGSDPPFFAYEFSTGSVFGVPELRANKRFKTGSSFIANIPGHEVSWLQDVQVRRIASWTAEWFKYSRASGAGGGPEVGVVHPLVLDELELLFVKDAGWARDIVAVKPELQKEWRLLGDALPGLQMTILTERLGLVKF